MSDGSYAPKERINITYKAKTNGQNEDVELPLKLMVMANLIRKKRNSFRGKRNFAN